MLGGGDPAIDGLMPWSAFDSDVVQAFRPA